MTQDEWIKDMARLIKERDRADAMISNWQEKRDAADSAIHYMRNPAEDAQAPEQATEPVQE